MTHPSWNMTLYHYPHDRQQAVTFHSEDELMRALDRMWDWQHHLFGVPRDVAGERTIILPLDAVPHLKEIGYTGSSSFLKGGRGRRGGARKPPRSKRACPTNIGKLYEMHTNHPEEDIWMVAHEIIRLDN